MLIVRGGARAELGVVHRAAPGRVRDGRGLRQRDRRHPGDGRDRRAAQRAAGHPRCRVPRRARARRAGWRRPPASGPRRSPGCPRSWPACSPTPPSCCSPAPTRRRPAALALAVLMLPTVVLTAEEAMKMVPRITKDAAYGMGCTRSQVIWKIVLPTRAAGHPDRRDAGGGPRGRRDRAPAVHRAVQQLLAVRGWAGRT